MSEMCEKKVALSLWGCGAGEWQWLGGSKGCRWKEQIGAVILIPELWWQWQY
jgi:hypothetical protein